MKDSETEETLTVQVDQLAFSSPRLRDELVLEPFIHFDFPFRSLSNPSLHELLGEGPLEPSSMPTPKQLD